MRRPLGRRFNCDATKALAPLRRDEASNLAARGMVQRAMRMAMQRG